MLKISKKVFNFILSLVLKFHSELNDRILKSYIIFKYKIRLLMFFLSVIIPLAH